MTTTIPQIYREALREYENAQRLLDISTAALAKAKAGVATAERLNDAAIKLLTELYNIDQMGTVLTEEERLDLFRRARDLPHQDAQGGH